MEILLPHHGLIACGNSVLKWTNPSSSAIEQREIGLIYRLTQPPSGKYGVDSYATGPRVTAVKSSITAKVLTLKSLSAGWLITPAARSLSSRAFNEASSSKQ